MTTATEIKPAYRVLALADAPGEVPRSGKPRSDYSNALAALAPNTVAEFAPCSAKHYGRSCSGSQSVATYAKRHKIAAKSWHVNGALYIARLS